MEIITDSKVSDGSCPTSVSFWELCRCLHRTLSAAFPLDLHLEKTFGQLLLHFPFPISFESLEVNGLNIMPEVCNGETVTLRIRFVTLGPSLCLVAPLLFFLCNLSCATIKRFSESFPNTFPGRVKPWERIRLNQRNGLKMSRHGGAKGIL